MQIREICEQLVYFYEMIGQWLYIYDRWGDHAQMGSPRRTLNETVLRVFSVVNSQEFNHLISEGFYVNHLSYLTGTVSRMTANFNEISASSSSRTVMTKFANIHTQLGFMIECLKYPTWA